MITMKKAESICTNMIGFYDFICESDGKMVIYKITNLLNGKVYVGSTIDRHVRWSEHRTRLLNNRHCNRHLQNSWNIHGVNNFKYEVIEYVDNIDELIQREQYWLDKIQSYNDEFGYNIRKIADRNTGITHSDETKSKLRDISNAYFKKHGHKSIYSFWVDSYGVDEADKRMIEYKKRHSDRVSGERNPMYGKKDKDNPNIKKIDQFSIDGELVRSWDGIIIASRNLKILAQNISHCCLGKRKTAGGFIWRFHKQK